MRAALEARIRKRIDRKRGDVFLRAGFVNLGSYDQVGRAVRRLVHQDKRLKIGSGSTPGR